MRESLTNKSVSSFWDLSRTSSLINVELILLGFILNVFELFEPWVLIRAWNFTRAVIELTHIILTCVSRKVFSQTFLIFLEILVYLSIILN